MALLPAKQKDIPLGKALCDKLGFVRGTARHQHVLLDSIRAWRKNYYTSSGVPAIELQNWSNEEVRVELKLLVIQFLNSSDHAERLWPANGFESPRFVPEYPEDKDRSEGKAITKINSVANMYLGSFQISPNWCGDRM